MKTNTYSRETKASLCELLPKGVCCRRALYGGLMLYRLPQDVSGVSQLTIKLGAEFASDDRNLVSDPDQLFVCEICRRSFLRGAFLACGSVSNPANGRYQLELVLPDPESASFICEQLERYSIEPLRTIRGGKTIVYFRDNEAIADFLNVVGAKNASYEFINVKIERGFENDANRAANCDIANISRTVDAAAEQIEAIDGLRKLGLLNKISKPLRDTAFLREEHSECTLAELAALHDPPITKSGVNHRLTRIVKIYEREKRGIAFKP